MSEYQAFKLWLSSFIHIDRDILHIFIGALIFLVSWMLLHRLRRAAILAFCLALLAGLAMEALDIRDTVAAGFSVDWPHTFGDIGHTILAPTIILLGVCVKHRGSNQRTKNE